MATKISDVSQWYTLNVHPQPRYRVQSLPSPTRVIWQKDRTYRKVCRWLTLMLLSYVYISYIIGSRWTNNLSPYFRNISGISEARILQRRQRKFTYVILKTLMIQSTHETIENDCTIRSISLLFRVFLGRSRTNRGKETRVCPNIRDPRNPRVQI